MLMNAVRIAVDVPKSVTTLLDLMLVAVTLVIDLTAIITPAMVSMFMH